MDNAWIPITMHFMGTVDGEGYLYSVQQPTETGTLEIRLSIQNGASLSLMTGYAAMRFQSKKINQVKKLTTLIICIIKVQ